MRAGMMAFAACAAITLVLELSHRALPAAGDDRAQEKLNVRIEALEKVILDQAHIMADVGDHFTNLWFAARAENWPLADFYLNETKSHLHWAVRAKPIRKDTQGNDINLENILQAFENGPLGDLKKTVDAKARAGFEKAYRACLETCYACHKASDKPYLRPQVPQEPETRIINFDPAATWPQ